MASLLGAHCHNDLFKAFSWVFLLKLNCEVLWPPFLCSATLESFYPFRVLDLRRVVSEKICTSYAAGGGGMFFKLQIMFPCQDVM